MIISYDITYIFIHILPLQKTSQPPVAQPKVDEKRLVMTMKQASLIASTTMVSFSSIGLLKGHILLIPLAGAIFSKDGMDNIYKDMFTEKINDLTKGALIASINQSCQSGGHSLAYSKCHIAICAALIATRMMKDRSVANNIVCKTYKQYAAAGKPYDPAKFQVFAKYATGGIPETFNLNSLMDELVNIQKLSARNRIAIEENNRAIIYTCSSNETTQEKAKVTGEQTPTGSSESQ
ncbi:PREDICTED: uncharacterized protein LOC108358286 [Rhagoletis zephyria]|uniref:uncharacterized protein LOC108358286 n=1 Tax=Rhagoletis zephyria TaxID=28612 RepID=UPI000811AA65|nr:PREDICTED: uncharacterized protein LOC108358286 [Rhagoletis zephyria]